MAHDLHFNTSRLVEDIKYFHLWLRVAIPCEIRIIFYWKAMIRHQQVVSPQHERMTGIFASFGLNHVTFASTETTPFLQHLYGGLLDKTSHYCSNPGNVSLHDAE
eukprot:633882_1